MKKRESIGLFARIKAWKENRRIRKEFKRLQNESSGGASTRIGAGIHIGAGTRIEESTRAAAEVKTASRAKENARGAWKNPAAVHKLTLGVFALILACSVLSLTAVTVAKYTKEIKHGDNHLTVTGHVGEWEPTVDPVQTASGGTLNGSFIPGEEQRTCTVCGAVESRYVFPNAIHNGDFPETYTNDDGWNVYTENRIVGGTVHTTNQPLTNWYGYNADEHAFVDVAATKDTETFYVGDETGALVLHNPSMAAVSVTNRFILVEGFTYRIGFWYRYDDVLYTTVTNLLMAVRQRNSGTGTWDHVADLKISENNEPVFQMGVTDKSWSYVSTTFTFADDGDATALEQGIFDLYLQLYQMRFETLVIDEFTCYPVTHTPENEKDEKYYTRYEVDRFNVPDFLILPEGGSKAYVADGGETEISRVTYSVAEATGYTLSADGKTLSFNQDGIYTVTASFETDNPHEDHSHVKRAIVTKKVKVRYEGHEVLITYQNEDGTTNSTETSTIGATVKPTKTLTKSGYRHDGWTYTEEDNDMAFLHKEETFVMKDYTVTLKPVFTQLIYDEEIYGAITTDKETGAYVEAYDFGNKDMWSGWYNYTDMITFNYGDPANWNDDTVTLSYPNQGDGKTAGSAHYHYAMELQRGVTYYLSGRVQIGRAEAANVGACQLMFAITETNASSPQATKTNLVCQLDPHVAQGTTLSDYDEYVLKSFTVPEDGMYFFSIFAWGMLELTDVQLSQFTVRGAEAGDANVNFAGFSSAVSSTVGSTINLPYVSIPGKKVEGWQQTVPVKGALTNTFIYPMGTTLWANVKDTNTYYSPYITKVYEYGAIADSNNLLKDFGNLPSSIYPARPLNNSLEWNTFGDSDAYASGAWDAENHTATFQVDYYGKVFDDEGNQKSKSAYYNYPVYLEAGKSYVLKATISFDELRYSTAGSCGVGITVFGGRYVTTTDKNGVTTTNFNTSSDYNYYESNYESRICPIIGYDSGTFGNVIQAGGQELTNTSREFSATFTAPESKTYYVCFRTWGIHTATNLTFSNVSLTPLDMKMPQNEYNYLGTTGSATKDAAIAGDITGWTTHYLAGHDSLISYNETENSLTFKLTDYTTAGSGNYGGIYFGKQVTLEKGTYELSATLNINKMTLRNVGGCQFKLFVSNYSDYGDGAADDAGRLIPGAIISYGAGTYTANSYASTDGTAGESTSVMEPIFDATRRTYFSIPTDGTYYFYMSVWCPNYFDVKVSDIAITSCQNAEMSQVVDRIAGVSAWDSRWDNIGSGNIQGEWQKSTVNTDKIVLNGTKADGGAGVAVKRVYLEQGVTYKLSATYTVSSFTGFNNNGSFETFIADMAYSDTTEDGFGSKTAENRLVHTAIGYELADTNDSNLAIWEAAVSNQTLSSYFVPERTGEFLLVFRFWNVTTINAEVSNITLNPVADENMLSPINYQKNWGSTANTPGFWQNTDYNEASVSYFAEDSTLSFYVAPKVNSDNSYYYDSAYVMAAQPVYLQKGKTYRLSYTMEIIAGYPFAMNQASTKAFAGVFIRNTPAGSSEAESERIYYARMGFFAGHYTDAGYLQKDANQTVLDSVNGLNQISYGNHAFAEEFTVTDSGVYYVHLNLWNLLCGKLRFQNLTLVEVRD